MNQLPHNLAQPFLQAQFIPTNNASVDDARFIAHVYANASEATRRRMRLSGQVKLLEYKPLASDRQQPHDIAVRAHSNCSYKKKEPLDVWAKRFMAQHPSYYALFESYALEAIRRGRRNFGAKAIVERMRWDESFDGGKPFKCPNALTRFLAERFGEENPEHAGFFKRNKRKNEM